MRERSDIKHFGPAFAFVATVPLTVIYGVLIVVPTVLAVLLSFTSWNGIGLPEWVGADNWVRFAGDSTAQHSFLVTIVFAAASWLVQTPVSLLLGLFIAGPQRYRKVYSVFFVIPMLLSSVGLALTWGGILDPNLGGLSWLGNELGVGFLSQNWFGEKGMTPAVLLVIIAWQFIPMHALIYQNGRRSIPIALYEAAKIDGASTWRQFLAITLPQLRHTIATSSVLMLVTSLTYFDMIYVLTKGGPGGATDVLAMQMYQVAFDQHEFGYASVFAVILGALGVVVGFLIMRTSGYSRFESEQEGAA